MGMLSRMSTVVKAKMNRLIDNAEDPKETLDYAYESNLRCCGTSNAESWKWSRRSVVLRFRQRRFGRT